MGCGSSKNAPVETANKTIDDESRRGSTSSNISDFADDGAFTLIPIPQTSLSPEAQDLVGKTTPVVAENLYGIATEFYPLLFSENPGTLGFFNNANQRTLAQPKALTDSIFKCVVNLKDLSVIDKELLQIAHKHCALAVPPSAYKVVHDTFLASVARVLGDAVTPEIGSAWSEVVVAVSKYLIDIEKQVYSFAAKRQGGWDARKEGGREFKVTKTVKVDGSDDIVSLYLEPNDGEPTPEFTPGQYITILDTPPSAAGSPFAPRHFSISHPSELRVTIRRVEGKDGAPEGAMTTYLSKQMQAGSLLHLRPPFGTFVRRRLEPGWTEVYISGGIGITPVVSMATASLKQGRRVVSLHMGECVSLHEEIVEAAKEANNGSFAHRGQREIMRDVEKHLRTNNIEPLKCVFYLCGNEAMIEVVADSLLKKAGVNVNNIHVEGFAPRSRFDFEGEVKGCPFHKG